MKMKGTGQVISIKSAAIARLGLAMAFAAHAQAPTGSAETELTAYIALERIEGDQVEPVALDHRCFGTGERFRVTFRPSRDGYAYLFGKVSPGGGTKILWPGQRRRDQNSDEGATATIAVRLFDLTGPAPAEIQKICISCFR